MLEVKFMVRTTLNMVRIMNIEKMFIEILPTQI